MADPFQLLLAFVLGIVAYAIAIQFIPGKQPGEDKFAQLLERIGVHTATVAANTTATQVAVANVAAAATPSNAAIAAAAQALALQNAQNSAGAAPKVVDAATEQPASAIAPAVEVAPAAVALEPSIAKESKIMRFVPKFLEMTGSPDASGLINIPWPVVPYIGVICSAPSNPGTASLRLRFKPDRMYKPVGSLKFSGLPEITAWDVSLVDANSGAIVVPMPSGWVHYVVDADPAQSDWIRLDSTKVYDVVCKRRTAEQALEDSRFELDI